MTLRLAVAKHVGRDRLRFIHDLSNVGCTVTLLSRVPDVFIFASVKIPRVLTSLRFLICIPTIILKAL